MTFPFRHLSNERGHLSPFFVNMMHLIYNQFLWFSISFNISKRNIIFSFTVIIDRLTHSDVVANTIWAKGFFNKFYQAISITRTSTQTWVIATCFLKGYLSLTIKNLNVKMPDSSNFKVVIDNRSWTETHAFSKTCTF